MNKTIRSPYAPDLPDSPDSPEGSGNVRWDRAIQALLNGATHKKAAREAGVDPATLYRWQKDLDFQAALQESRRQAFGLAMGRIQQAANIAANTLIEIMNDPGAAVGGRVQAAKCVLELSRKSLELDYLKNQVAELQGWRRAQEEGSFRNAA